MSSSISASVATVARSSVRAPRVSNPDDAIASSEKEWDASRQGETWPTSVKGVMRQRSCSHDSRAGCMVVTTWPIRRAGAGRPGGTTGSETTEEGINDINQSARFCINRLFVINACAIKKYQFNAINTYRVRNRKIAIMMMKKLCQSAMKT